MEIHNYYNDIIKGQNEQRKTMLYDILTCHRLLPQYGAPTKINSKHGPIVNTFE